MLAICCDVWHNRKNVVCIVDNMKEGTSYGRIDTRQYEAADL